MNWCPRCDTLSLAKPGDLCDACGAEIADVTPLRSPRRTNGRQLLEVDPEPIVIDDDRADEVVPVAPKRPRNRKRLIAFVLAVATVAGSSTAYALAKRHPAPPRPHRAPRLSAPVPSPPIPPFGRALSGKIATVGPQGMSIIDLATGREENVDLPPDVWQVAASRDGSMSAFIDPKRFLYVYAGSVAVEERTVLAGEVNSFKWLPDGKRILVERSTVDARGGGRHRIEYVDTEPDTHPKLLYEGYLPVTQVHPAGRRVLFDIQKDPPPPPPGVEEGQSEGTNSIYLLEGGRARLLLDHYSTVEVSRDGTTAFVKRDADPGLFLLNIASKRLRRVGNAQLVATSASFGPKGAAVVVASNLVWTLDLKTLSLTPIANISEDVSLWGPSWHAGGRWVVFASNQGYCVISLDMKKLFVRSIEGLSDVSFI